jgi:hypothetical protein
MAKYYGTAVPRPTGHGLPGFEDGAYSTRAPLPPLSEVVWCDEAGCPASECVACKKRA